MIVQGKLMRAVLRTWQNRQLIQLAKITVQKSQVTSVLPCMRWLLLIIMDILYRSSPVLMKPIRQAKKREIELDPVDIEILLQLKKAKWRLNFTWWWRIFIWKKCCFNSEEIGSKTKGAGKDWNTTITLWHWVSMIIIEMII